MKLEIRTTYNKFVIVMNLSSEDKHATGEFTITS